MYDNYITTSNTGKSLSWKVLITEESLERKLCPRKALSKLCIYTYTDLVFTGLYFFFFSKLIRDNPGLVTMWHARVYTHLYIRMCQSVQIHCGLVPLELVRIESLGTLLVTCCCSRKCGPSSKHSFAITGYIITGCTQTGVGKHGHGQFCTTLDWITHCMVCIWYVYTHYMWVNVYVLGCGENGQFKIEAFSSYIEIYKDKANCRSIWVRYILCVHTTESYIF